VNINTASSEVLQSLSDLMTQGVAEAIVAFRTQAAAGQPGQTQEFQKPDDLKRVQGMSDGIYASISGQIAVKATTFEIRTRGTVGKVEKSWVYVVQRKGGAPTPGGATPPVPPPPPPSGGAAPGPAPAGHTLIGAQALNDFTSSKPPEIDK